jgi:tRNA threonylcarbamoyladenosine modification (KEOPS) complex  Pcc1 subunit
MKYSSQIIVKEDPDKIEKLFASEEKAFANERANYSLKKEGKELKITLQAKDAVALRAVLNSVVKMLITYEQTKSAIEEIQDE